MKYSYSHPRPAVTVDALVFSRRGEQVYIALIRRAHPPFKDQWAFPGGFVDIDESLEQAVSRELKEETSLKNIQLEQFYTFGDVHRDPRHRTITVSYIGFTSSEIPALQAGDDAGEAAWFPVDELPTLAFDHDEILRKAMEKLQLVIN
jgi:8-oxo-dGTP diphosphatase